MKLTKENIAKAFQPSAPIKNRNDFVGRKNLLKHIDRSINSVGKQIIVFGERGVGKTSFINIGLDLTYLKKDYKIYEYNCSYRDSYYDIIGSFLRATGQLLSTSESKSSKTQSVDARLKIPIAEGGGKSEEYHEEIKKAVIPSSFTPNDIVANYLMGKIL